MAAEHSPELRRSSSYCPSLDGLRAVAILLVIAYHGGALRGGFLGVQLFFVLSGYLITSLLLREHEATGTIRLVRFYERRLLRLAPALCLYVLVAWVVTHWLNPALAEWLRGSWALAALFYVSNLVIAFGGQYPLGIISICWSLALEEQFYLVWPAMLRLLHRARLTRRAVASLLAGLIAACLALRYVLLARRGGDPDLWLRVYFGPDTGAEALIWGCLLALVPGRVGQGLAKIGAATALVGAGALGYMATRVDIADLVARPVLLSLSALLCTVLVFGALARGPLRRALELPVLVWIGQLSYSLYLWHAFSHDLFVEQPRWRRYAFLLSAAAASYYLLERPVQSFARRWGALERPHPWSRRGRSGASASPRSAGWEAAPGLTIGAAGLVLALALGCVRLTGLAVPGLGLAPSVQARERYSDGLALYRAHDTEAAAVAFRQAIRLDPEHADAHIGLGGLALERGATAEAIQHLSRAAALRPQDALVHHEVGVALAMEGRYEDAISEFQASLRLGGAPGLEENLARALIDRDRQDPTGRDPD